MDVKKLAEKKHYWEGVLREGEVSLLVGRAMAGKSTFACALARSLRSGTSLLDRDCLATKVGYMALERNGLSVAELFEKWGLGEIAFLDYLPRGSAETLAKFLEEEIRRLSLEVVIVDHLQNLVNVADANDYATVSKNLAPFHRVAKVTNCHLMLLHHQPKAKRGTDEIDALGSEAYRASADVLIEVQKRDERHYVRGTIRGAPDLGMTLVAINLETGEVEGIDATEAEIRDATKTIIRFLTTRESGGVSEREIRENTQLRSNVVSSALRRGVNDQTFVREGEGKRGDTFLYRNALPTARPEYRVENV